MKLTPEEIDQITERIDPYCYYQIFGEMEDHTIDKARQSDIAALLAHVKEQDKIIEGLGEERNSMERTIMRLETEKSSAQDRRRKCQ